MFAAMLFLMLACLCGLGWIGWQMMPLCPSEDGFAGYDLREASGLVGRIHEGETQGAASVASCVGLTNE